MSILWPTLSHSMVDLATGARTAMYTRLSLLFLLPGPPMISGRLLLYCHLYFVVNHVILCPLASSFSNSNLFLNSGYRFAHLHQAAWL